MYMLKASHNIHYCKSLRDFTEIMPRFDLSSVSKVSNMIWEQHVSSLMSWKWVIFLGIFYCDSFTTIKTHIYSHKWKKNLWLIYPAPSSFRDYSRQGLTMHPCYGRYKNNLPNAKSIELFCWSQIKCRVPRNSFTRFKFHPSPVAKNGFTVKLLPI